MDSSTGLAWLDVNFSDGRSYDDVAAQFGAGGDFEGFRYATEAEVLELFANAGIPDLPASGTATSVQSSSNHAPIMALLSLIGTSHTNLALGITSTPSVVFPGHQTTAFVQLIDPDGISGLSGTAPDQVNGASGSWLVKPAITTVAIDIKPGSDPNCFNIDGHGLIPVAILGSGTFDVTQVDTQSLLFGSFMVRVRGKKGPQCSLEFVDSDAFQDLVCHFEDDGREFWDPDDDATVMLSGVTFGGSQFEGNDRICVVP